MPKTILFIFITSLLAGSCTENHKMELPDRAKGLDNLITYSENDQTGLNFNFLREESFGDTENVFIKRIKDVEVDNSGKVYLAQRYVFHVYEPDGTVLENIGQSGSGPGEFESLANIEIRSDRLFAYDAMAQRMNVYSLDPLQLKDEVGVSPGNEKFFRGQFYAINEAMLLVGFEDPGTPDVKRFINFYKLTNQQVDQSAEILKLRIEDIFRYQSGRRIAMGTVPFSRTTLVTPLDDNLIYTAWTENFLIKIFNKSGTYLRAIYYPYRNAPVRQEKYLNNLSGFSREASSSYKLPQTQPALHSMLTDDENRLWISTIVEDDEIYQWWVLEENGKLITRFEWPRNKEIKVIKNGKIYTLEKEEETGLEEVVRYRIEMREKTGSE